MILRNPCVNSLDQVTYNPITEVALSEVTEDPATETAWSEFCAVFGRSKTDDRAFKSYVSIVLCLGCHVCIKALP